MFSKYRFFIGFFIAIVFFLINIPLISSYGINWDEPAHYLRGQSFLRFFFTGETDYKDLPTIQTQLPKNIFSEQKRADFPNDTYFRRSIYQIDQRGVNSQTFQHYAHQPSGHPPINGELASLTNVLLYQYLGIAGDIESYHLFILAVSALLVFIVYVFVAGVYGVFAGVIACLSLILYPLFFAESHFNIKDTVSASFYTVTLFAFYRGITERNLRWMFVSAIVAGFALGTKFNIFFALLTVVTWFLVAISRSKPFPKFSSSFILISLCFYLFIPLVILYVSWPALWNNPISGIIKTFEFYKSIGYDTQYQSSNYIIFGTINTYALHWLFFSTPLIILFFSSIGIIYALRKGFSEKYSISLFLLFWFLFPILRVTIGGFSIYGGLRQIMEFVPAMAMLSGIGGAYIIQLLYRYGVKNIKQVPPKKLLLLFQTIIVLLFIPIALKLISIHPNENVYFNPLVGGLKGAKEKNFPDWGVTLGSAYQQGINWLNKNAPKDANLALVRGLHSNIPRIKLRQDINFDNRYYSGEKKKGEYIIEVVDYNWYLHVPEEKRNYLSKLRPVYAVKVDGVEILKIWKNEEKYINKVVISAAGDIACGPDHRGGDCREWDTSELVRKMNPDAVLVLGDLQYEAAPLEYFMGEDPYCKSTPPHCYGPTWGRFKDKTFPAAGNHEYSIDMENADGYYDYFNGVGNFSGRARDRDKGYYSFDLGSWHLIALNSECSAVGCDIDSPQVKWLQEDLRRSKKECTLAFWHHPRFSNGTHGNDTRFSAFWEVLYGDGAEIIVNGHDHDYERFPRFNANGNIDPINGIRQFIVGTGGYSLTPVSKRIQSRVSNNETYGVLKLALYHETYDWQFVPIEGMTFTDSGHGSCH